MRVCLVKCPFVLQGQRGEPGAKGDQGMDGLPGLKVSMREDPLTPS